MFNKSTLFNRNDPVSRREGTPASPGNTRQTPPSESTGGRPVTAAKEVPGASVASTAPSVTAPFDSATASSPTVETKVAATAESGADTGLGARLIVGPEVKLKGAEILDCDTLVVEGRVEATMDSRVVRIAEHGAFVGKVSIDIAEIHGSFEGELTARSQLIIHSTGRVKGTIRYGRLMADEGCELCGDIAVLSQTSTAKPKVGGEVPVVPAVLNAAAG